MRDEINRNTYGDLVNKQYEQMDPMDPMTDIPEEEPRGSSANTSRGLNGTNGLAPSGTDGLEEETAGKLPLDHVPADTAFSLGEDANATYPRRNPQYDPAYREDARLIHERDQDKGQAAADSGLTEDDPPLEDIPDADELQAGSPVDPAFPQGTDQHGIDLLNGVGGVDDDTGRKLPENF